MKKLAISLALVLGLTAGTAALAAATPKIAAPPAAGSGAAVTAPDQNTAPDQLWSDNSGPDQAEVSDRQAPAPGVGGRFGGQAWRGGRMMTAGGGQGAQMMMGRGFGGGAMRGSGGRVRHGGFGVFGAIVGAITILLVWTLLVLSIIALVRHLRKKPQ